MEYVPSNFHKALQTHSVALLNKRTTEVATGVLLDHQGTFLVLTVAHILEKIEPDELLIHLGIPGQRYPMKKEKIWKNDTLDLAYIKLNTFEATIFQNRVVPLVIRQKAVRDVAKKPLQCALCGYPKSMAYFEGDTSTIAAETLLVTTRPLLPESWPVGIKGKGKDPKLNFLLKYGPKRAQKILDQNRNAMSLVDPHGLSGAGVWVYDPASENSEHPKYALFGIQTGYYAREQLLVGTAIEPLVAQVEIDFGAALRSSASDSW
jgi:hypothetical protein